MEILEVYTAKDEIEANMIVSALDAASIKCHTQDVGAGQYMDVYMGFSVYGKKIFVMEDKVEEAKRIISEIMEIQENDEDELIIPWYKNKKIIVRIGIVVFVVITATILVVANI